MSYQELSNSNRKRLAARNRDSMFHFLGIIIVLNDINILACSFVLFSNLEENKI